MKKLLVFMLLLGCLGVTFAFKNEKNPIFQMSGVEQVCFVSSRSYADEFEVETVNCGDLVFNFCSVAVAKENVEGLKDLQGMQFYFAPISLEELLKTLKAEVVSEEFVEGLRIVNAYTPYYGDSVFVQNKKVNLQIALSAERVVAGFPMILTGY